MFFVMKINFPFQFTSQIKNLKIQQICCLYLMEINYIMCTSKILTDLCFTKQKVNKKYCCKNCLQCFSSKNVLKNHKEVCLSISDVQSVRLEKGTIKFKNTLKQIPVPFKIYSEFECFLNSVRSYEMSCSKNIKITFFVALLTILFMLMLNLVNQLFCSLQR